MSSSQCGESQKNTKRDMLNNNSQPNNQTAWGGNEYLIATLLHFKFKHKVSDKPQFRVRFFKQMRFNCFLSLFQTFKLGVFVIGSD